MDRDIEIEFENLNIRVSEMQTKLDRLIKHLIPEMKKISKYLNAQVMI